MKKSHKKRITKNGRNREGNNERVWILKNYEKMVNRREKWTTRTRFEAIGERYFDTTPVQLVRDLRKERKK